MAVRFGSESVLVSEEKKQWHDRGQYAEILRDLISSQLKQYKNARDNMKKNISSLSIPSAKLRFFRINSTTVLIGCWLSF